MPTLSWLILKSEIKKMIQYFKATFKENVCMQLNPEKPGLCKRRSVSFILSQTLIWQGQGCNFCFIIFKIKIIREQSPFQQYLRRMHLQNENRLCVLAPPFLNFVLLFLFVWPCQGHLLAFLNLSFFLYQKSGYNLGPDSTW